MIIDDGKGLREQLESMIEQEKARLRGTKGITYHTPTSKLHIPKPVVNNTTDDTYTIVYQGKTIGQCSVLKTSGKGNSCGIYAVYQQLKRQYPQTYSYLEVTDDVIQAQRDELINIFEVEFRKFKRSSNIEEINSYLAGLIEVSGMDISFDPNNKNDPKIQKAYEVGLQRMKHGSLSMGTIQIMIERLLFCSPLIGFTKDKIITLQNLPKDVTDIEQLQDDGKDDDHKIVFITNNGKNHWESVIIQDEETKHHLFDLLWRAQHEDFTSHVRNQDADSTSNAGSQDSLEV